MSEKRQSKVLMHSSALTVNSKSNAPSIVTACIVAVAYVFWTNVLYLNVRLADESATTFVLRLIGVSITLLAAAAYLLPFLKCTPRSELYLMALCAGSLLVPTFFVAIIGEGEEINWLWRSQSWNASALVLIPLLAQRNNGKTVFLLLDILTALVTVSSLIAALAMFGVINGEVYNSLHVVKKDGLLHYPLAGGALVAYLSIYQGLAAGESTFMIGLIRRMACAALIASIYTLTMSRQFVLFYSIVLLLSLITCRKRFVLKTLLAVIFIGVLLSGLAAFYEPLVSIGREAQARSGTLGVRMQGIEYYWPIFLQTSGIGYGLYSSTDGPLTAVKYGMTLGYNHNDYGLVGTLLQYGIVGVSICVGILIWISLQLRKHTRVRGIRFAEALRVATLSHALALLLVPTNNTFLYKSSHMCESAMFLAAALTLIRLSRTLEPTKEAYKYKRRLERQLPDKFSVQHYR